MNWEYSLKILRDTSGNIARITPTKELKSDIGEVLASVEVGVAEYANTIPDAEVAKFFTDSAALFHTEISSMFGYDPALTTHTKGVSNSNSGYATGACISVVLDIGMSLVVRLNGGN
jgi:hypothetical protein